MAIAEFIRTWASVIIFALQAVVTVVWWAIRKSLATKGDMDVLTANVQAVDRRVSSLEQWRQEAPTANELNDLKLELERARGTMGAVAAELRGARETMSAEVKGVHAALKRTERLVSIQTEHLMGLKR
jgi:hypothetical protein